MSFHSCTDLLNITREGLVGVRDWLGSVREDKLQCFMKTTAFDAKRQNSLDEVQRLRHRIVSVLDDFKKDKRYGVNRKPIYVFSWQLLALSLKVLDPYKSAFDSSADDPDYAMPPHRYLFNCYVYQFHLMQFSVIVINMVCTFLPPDKGHALIQITVRWGHKIGSGTGSNAVMDACQTVVVMEQIWYSRRHRNRWGRWSR